jgi:hypothetical protein
VANSATAIAHRCPPLGGEVCNGVPFFAKPFDAEHLLATVASLLAR